MTWENVSDHGSRFITLTKKVHAASLVLEEVNKRWDLPYNWRLTCCNDNAAIVWSEEFYLDVECNTTATAQVRADSLITNHKETDWRDSPT